MFWKDDLRPKHMPSLWRRLTTSHSVRSSVLLRQERHLRKDKASLCLEVEVAVGLKGTIAVPAYEIC